MLSQSRRVLVAFAALALCASWSSVASAASTCVDDVAGDTIDTSSQAPAPEPRADLLRSCLDFGDVLVFSTVTSQPSDPNADPIWYGITQASWFVDVNGDDMFDFHVAFAVDNDRGALIVYVFLPADETPEPTIACEGTPTFDGTTYTATVEAPCLGNPASVRFYARMFVDSDPEPFNDSPLYADLAPAEAVFSAPVTATPPRPSSRLAGPSRIDTAVAVSQHQFPSGASSVYVARADDAADAVAAGSLRDGPILLVPSCDGVPAAVAQEIARLSPTRVVALGGEAAVCEATLQQAAEGRTGERLAGASRIDTSLAIAREAFPDGASTLYLARADVLADAVAAGSLDAGPVLLVPNCGDVPEGVADEVRRSRPEQVVALGGQSAVCDQLLTAVAESARGSRAPSTTRIAGDSRVATAVAISATQFPGPVPEVYLARFDVAADAVAAGSLTAGPVLLVPPCGDLPEAVRAEITRLDPGRVIALGGPGAVCETMLRSAASR